MGFFYGFDMTYLVFIVPCIIITLICQVKVKTTFSKYSQIRNSRNMTGAQAAEYVLRQHGVTGVRIEHVAGSMTDHFDPRTNVIRLSDTVFNSTSVAAVGVACHEAGHAVVSHYLETQDPVHQISILFVSSSIIDAVSSEYSLA